MTIVPLNKVTIFGLLDDKPALLSRLQALGVMHLIPLSPGPAEIEKTGAAQAEAAQQALRFLQDAPDPRRQVTRAEAFDVAALIEEATALREATREAEDRRDFLVARIATVERWGDIDFPPRDRIAGLRLWFYQLPVKNAAALQNVTQPWSVVHRDNRFLYVVLIAEDEPPKDVLPVPRSHIGAKPLSALQEELEEVEVRLEDFDSQRRALTRFTYLLNVNIAAAQDAAALATARQRTLDDDAISAVQGWAPEDALPAITALADELGLAYLTAPPSSDETPPTLLHQPDPMQAGRALAMFYQAPGYRSWDPSLVVFTSFALFFAMIIADAGYGLLLMGGLLAYWRRMGETAPGRAWRLMGLALSGASVVYGAMVGSYFGIAPDPASALGGLKVMDVGDFDTMMILSIVIGVLHIALANAMAAWAKWGRRSAFANFGWILGVFGGLTLWQISEQIGLGLVGTGLIMVLLFSSDRPVAKPIDHLLRLLDGAQGVAGVMGVFGDVLSYMRLFALGLASASLAMTFNNLAADMRDAMPGMGVLLAALLLLLGHGINLGLSLMSGVIHGLRLNFIEFYKWGLPDEGIAFEPFARKEVRP